MARLEQPRGLKINFSPSARQFEVWNALQPNRCDKCGGELTMVSDGFDENGHDIYKPACKKCGNTDIPEQILSGGSAGGGKCCLLDSYVCTPFGFRQVKDLQIGSIITDPDTGGMQKVTYLHPIGEFDFYRIHFVDGTHVDCSEGHQWRGHESRKKTKKAKKYGEVDRLFSTLEIYEWYQRKKQGMYNQQNIIIPLTKPVVFTLGARAKVTVDPYVLGALIGDGCITDSFIRNGCVEFTTMDQEILDEFIKAGIEIPEGRRNRPDNQAKTYIIKNQELVEQIKKLGIAGNNSQTHYIPMAYKYASIEDRKRIIQGLMDTDGYVDDRGHMIFTSTSEQLAEDVAFIIRSLGGVATITQHKSGYKDAKGNYVQCSDHFDVQIRTKMNPELVHISRKKRLCTYDFNGGNSELGKRIIDVEYIGKRTSRCISVSNDRGLYLTDDFTVTHNSYLGCCWLVSSCVRFDGIRMVVARKVRKTLLESTWKTLKDVLREWGFIENVNYHINNQACTITFWNGSEIIAMELAPSPSDPDFNSLGSLEITGGFIDEVSEVSEKAVEVLASRIRYKIAETFIVGKLLMSTNPCLGWVRSTFVMDDDGNPVTLLPGYRYIPFSLFDNPNPSFRATYYNKLRKLRSKEDRNRLLYGDWRFITANKMAAYWNFDGDTHLCPGLKESRYDPHKPLILSFDFNVDPYMSCLPMQFDFENKFAYVFPEYIGLPKDNRNNTPSFSRWIAAQLKKDGHVGGVLVTGDPSGLHRSTQTEEGVNNYTIVIKNLSNGLLNPKLNILSKQPAHVTRLEFVNQLFKNFKGWRILVDPRCHRLLEDFSYQQKNPDGTKEKKKVQDDKGKKVEKWGHLSDCFDYGMVYYLGKEYQLYRTSSTDIVVTCEPADDYPGQFDY